MTRFSYAPLNIEDHEVRLLTLNAGIPSDNIVFSVSHAPLPPQIPLQSKRLSLSELEKTLPQGWFVKQTLTGRYLFICDDDVTPTTWNHPDSEIDRALYYDPPPEYTPRYEALSYTWGTMENPTTAYIQSPTSPTSQYTVLEISQTLASALQHLRYHDRKRTLWVDAVCINQADMAEREKQVKRMDSIYSLAHRVIVWLGPSSPDSTHALKTLEYFANQVEHTVDSIIFDAPDVQEPEWFRRSHALPYDEYTWQSLTALFQRPWFTRVWVLQETMLANSRARVQCGLYDAAREIIQKTVLAMYAKNGVPLELERMFWGMRNAMRPKDSLSFLTLLSMTRARQSSDLRDKVYGILGVAPRLFLEKLQPSYAKSVAEVYRDAFLVYTEMCKRASMLCYCAIELRLQDAPSWIPNWAVDTTGYLAKTMSVTRYASGPSRADVRYVGLETLKVLGMVCSEVDSVTVLPTGDAEVKEALCKWQLEKLRDGRYVDGSDCLDAFLEVISCGRTTDRYTETRKYTTLANMRKQYNSQNDDRFGFLDTSELEDAALVTTKEGFIGIAARTVKPGPRFCSTHHIMPLTASGDKIYTIMGCDVLLLLRTHPSISSAYLVIGPCFVHGLLDAESLLGPLPHPWKLQMLLNNLGYQTAHFFNEKSGEVVEEDPRLPPLPEKWRCVRREATSEDPWDFVADWVNNETGVVLNSDPRMEEEVLRERGVTVEWLELV